MAGVLLRTTAIFVVLSVTGIINSAVAAWLCNDPATSVGTLVKQHSANGESADQSRSPGPIIVQGVYQKSSLSDRFTVVVRNFIWDASDDRSSITVHHTAASPGSYDFQSGDLVTIRGSIVPVSDEFGLQMSLEAGADGLAVASCHDVLQSYSTRRLAQTSGKKKSTKRRTAKSSAAKKKPKRKAPSKSKKKPSRKKSPSRRKIPAKKKAPSKKRAPSRKRTRGNRRTSGKKKAPSKKRTPKKKSPPKKKTTKKKSPSTSSGGTPSPKSSPSATGNSWKSVKNLPLSMGEVSAGVLKSDGKSYMIVVGQHPRGDDKNGATMIFDFSKQVWYEATGRPEIGNHHASEVINNKLYLFGGLSGGEGDVQIGTLKDTGTGIDITWKKGAGLPFDGGSAATALIGGKVYYCGGINKSNTDTVSNCAIYDPDTDSWTQDSKVAPNMPKGRNHAAACSDGKKLYVFGGRDGRNIVGPGFADTQILEPGKGWTTGKSLPLARGGMGKAVYHKGKCYVFGGEVAPDVKVSMADKIEASRTVYRVDVYDISSNSWSLAKDMPNGLHGMFPVKHNGKVYLAAGGTEAAYSQSKLHYEYTL